jgi:quinol monooxygenase YgiN
MVISTLRIVPLPKQRSEVIEILRSVLGPTETQPGCLRCQISEEEGSDRAIMFCGYWESEEALREHVRSDRYLRVLAACELSRLPPEFCFYDVSKTEGIELIRQVRGSKGEQSPGDLAGSGNIKQS